MREVSVVASGSSGRPWPWIPFMLNIPCINYVEISPRFRRFLFFCITYRDIQFFSRFLGDGPIKRSLPNHIQDIGEIYLSPVWVFYDTRYTETFSPEADKKGGAPLYFLWLHIPRIQYQTWLCIHTCHVFNGIPKTDQYCSSVLPVTYSNTFYQCARG